MCTRLLKKNWLLSHIFDTVFLCFNKAFKSTCLCYAILLSKQRNFHILKKYRIYVVILVHRIAKLNSIVRNNKLSTIPGAYLFFLDS